MRYPKSTVLAVLASLALGATITSTSAYEFEVTNQCEQSIRLALRYHDSRDSTWKTKAWYDLQPGEETYLADENDRRIDSDTGTFYFFAETLDGKFTWKGVEDNAEDRTYRVGDRRLRFRKTYDSGTDNDLSLVCRDLEDTTEPIECCQNNNPAKCWPVCNSPTAPPGEPCINGNDVPPWMTCLIPYGS